MFIIKTRSIPSLNVSPSKCYVPVGIDILRSDWLKSYNVIKSVEYTAKVANSATKSPPDVGEEITFIQHSKMEDSEFRGRLQGKLHPDAIDILIGIHFLLIIDHYLHWNTGILG